LVHLWVWGVRGLSNFDLLVGLLWLVSVWCGLVTGCGAWLGLVALLVAPRRRGGCLSLCRRLVGMRSVSA
jgi:hypothetical protein